MANRKIVGCKVSWFHPQHADRSKPDRHNNRKDLGPADDYITGRAQFNSFAEKNFCSLNFTPQLKEADGSVVDLQEGDPENADVQVDPSKYFLEVNGKRYTGDEMQSIPGFGSEPLHNYEQNFGLMPQFVFGPELSGDHEVKGGGTVNSFECVTHHAIRLNG